MENRIFIVLLHLTETSEHKCNKRNSIMNISLHLPTWI